MLSVEQNKLLTQVGPGTPTGELMRRYWHPIAGSAEMRENPTKGVRILGEDLVLYKDRSGVLGLIQESCPHRRVNLLYGIPEQQGIRCPYHGWLFDESGRCLEMPAEAPDSTFKDRVTARTYPVQELGGLIFAYLGPKPAPLLPRWDLLVWENVVRDIGVSVVPCNWLQCMENSLDPTHTEWLHGWYMAYMRERRLAVGSSAVGVDPEQYERDVAAGNPAGQPPIIAGGFQATSERLPGHARIGFDIFEHGVIKRRMYSEGSEDDPSWRIGHPVVFPNILRVGTTMQIRVPMDDSHTYHIMYGAYYAGPDIDMGEQEEVPVYDIPVKDPQGRFISDFVLGQDSMVWATQGMRNGGLAERHLEKLGESDKGIILFRRLVSEQAKIVQDGGEPMNVFRDPAKNQVVTLFQETDPFEAAKPENRAVRKPGLSTGQTPYSPVIAQVEEAWERAGGQQAGARPQTIG